MTFLWQKKGLQQVKDHQYHCNPLILLVPPARLEHAACGLGIRRSIHLSYGGKVLF